MVVRVLESLCGHVTCMYAQTYVITCKCALCGRHVCMHTDADSPRDRHARIRIAKQPHTRCTHTYTYIHTFIHICIPTRACTHTYKPVNEQACAHPQTTCTVDCVCRIFMLRDMSTRCIHTLSRAMHVRMLIMRVFAQANSYTCPDVSPYSTDR
jgi:hypothetical protein